jgi:DNA-binding IclR family transcriptional regulator
MDGPPLAGSTARALQAKGFETERTSAIPRRAGAGDPGRGNPDKPVGAAAKVLRTLQASERPLNASTVARAAGLHCGTAYNILRTLYAEGFVGYDEATRSGLMDLARPLMHAVSDAHGVSVYLSKVLGPSSLLLLDWVGAAFRTDLYVTVGRQYPGPAGASGVIMGAFGSGNETELEACSQRSPGTASRPSPISWRASERRGHAASRWIGARGFRASRTCRCRSCRRHASCSWS